MADWFDSFRADIETWARDVYSPPEFDAAVTYQGLQTVQVAGTAYQALATPQAAGAFDPDYWVELGPVYPVLYENTIQKVPAGGAARIIVSFEAGDTSTIICNDLERTVTGTVTLFLYTPANQGTKAGLSGLQRWFNLYSVWNHLPPAWNCASRPCMKLSNPVGPASAGPAADLDFFTHNLSGTLTGYIPMPEIAVGII